jgi:hypothetical protein
MSLRDFLNWFEGFSDNLDGPPNDQQWEKVRKRINALSPEPAAPSESSPSEPVGGAATTATWRNQVKDFLTNNDILSLDPETAEEELAKVRITHSHLNIPPDEFAMSVLDRLKP